MLTRTEIYSPYLIKWCFCATWGRVYGLCIFFMSGTYWDNAIQQFFSVNFLILKCQEWCWDGSSSAVPVHHFILNVELIFQRTHTHTTLGITQDSDFSHIVFIIFNNEIWKRRAIWYEIWLLVDNLNSVDVTSVSYTHLDVYKRQAIPGKPGNHYKSSCSNNGIICARSRKTNFNHHWPWYTV